jgi:hypothetical protein
MNKALYNQFIILLTSRLLQTNKCVRPYSSLEQRKSNMSKEFSLLAPGWNRENRELSFGSWLVQRGSHLLLYFILSFTDSQLVLTIWQLKSYSFLFDLYGEVGYQIKQIRVCDLLSSLS